MNNTPTAPLSSNEIPYVLPQHLNHQKFAGRTEKYSLFESDTIIAALAREGLVVRDAFSQKARSANAGGTEVRRHCYRLCREEDFGKGTDIPEVVLVNSHNGACSLRAYTGYFRMVCSNGLIAGGKEALRIRHMGHTMDEVLHSIVKVADNFGNLYGALDSFRTRMLTGEEAREFAVRANDLRTEIGLRAVGDLNALLTPRRAEDNGNSLWQVYNVVQENIMKGGIPLAYDGTEKRKRMTRALTNIPQNIAVNEGLWRIAEDFVG